jgi:hypothetical protein
MYLHSGADSSFWQVKIRWNGREKYMTQAYRDGLLSENSKTALHLLYGRRLIHQRQDRRVSVK